MSNFAAAGNEMARQAAQSWNVTRSTSPNMGNMVMEGMKLKSKEKRAYAEIEQEMHKRHVQIKGELVSQKNKLKEGEVKRDAKRKAGGLALLGKMAPVAVDLLTDEKGKRREVGATSSKYDAAIAKLRNSAENLRGSMQDSSFNFTPLNVDTSSSSFSTSSTGNGGSSNTGNGGTAGKVSGGSSLSGNQKVVADAIAKYESGDWGYEAFNQGGAAGGTKVVGKSGNHKETFGRSLTDMTLGEIFKKQNTKQQGMSFQEHLNSGGLHAVGRYQFIGSTLQDEVAKMGLSHDTKFTPEVQDQIFLSHIKRVGSISPWVGPMQNYSAAEKAKFKNMIAGF